MEKLKEVLKHLVIGLKYVVILIIVCQVINFLTPLSDSITNLIDRFSPPASVDVVSNRVIISSLKGIGQLITVTSDEPQFGEVLITIKEGFLDSGYYAANHAVEGFVEAGIDFSKIQQNDLSHNSANDSYTLIVPAPYFTNCIIVKLRQKDQSLGIAKDWELLEELAQYEAIGLFMEKVEEENKALEKAKDQTENLLGDFIGNLTGKPVDIVFEDPSEEPELGQTCRPEPPFGWEKDANDEWGRTN